MQVHTSKQEVFLRCNQGTRTTMCDWAQSCPTIEGELVSCCAHCPAVGRAQLRTYQEATEDWEKADILPGKRKTSQPLLADFRGQEIL